MREAHAPLGSPRRPGASASEPRPRHVFCVVAREYRKREIADAVCAGRFTHHGLTLELGPDPDWSRAVHDGDREWRIECSKFYYGLDLAHAFRTGRDVKYLNAWRRVVTSWIEQVAVGADPSDVAGRRILNWTYAWNSFARAPHFTGLGAGQAQRILASLEHQVQHLRAHLTPERNHRTLELYALFIAALAWPALDPTGELLQFALARIHENLLTDVLPDGVHREASTHYHMIALRTFLGVRANAACFGLSLPDGFDERLEKACEFALHFQRPDGEIPALSDSDTGRFARLLLLASRLLGRPDFLYAASAGFRGEAPRARCAAFPRGGYYIQRSGWGENGTTSFRDERYLIFDCGPLGDGGHGHYDLLNVEIAAGGRQLLVDPGRYSYSEQQPNWRRWFKGTAAHNTVCVDGHDQTPYRTGKPKGPVAQGRLIEHTGAPDLDVLRGEVLSPLYEAVHRRRIVFVAREYWIIEDVLTGARPHGYDLRFHFPAEAWERVTLSARQGAILVQAPGVSLVVLSPGAGRIEPGWVSPRYGIKQPAPVLSVTVEGLAETRFLTLVVPRRGSEERAAVPALTVLGGAGSSSSALVVEVRGLDPDEAVIDRLTWSEAPSLLTLGVFSEEATAAWLRESADGRPLRFQACGAPSGPAWVAWDARSGFAREPRP